MHQRRFSMQDQEAFARLSGDTNPAHTDPLAARRTLFGRTVVHGVHSALWALDAWASDLACPADLRSVRCEFLKPIAVDSPVSVSMTPAEGGRAAVLVVSCDGIPATRIGLTWDTAAAHPGPAPRDAFPPAAPSRDVAEDRAREVEGALDLYLHATAARALFPRLLDRVSPSAVALLLAATRLVGVECPGLRSVFSALTLAADGAGGASLRYRVSEYDRRFHRVTLAVEGGGLAGTITAFFRPPPRAQADCAHLAALVTPREFAGVRALVVGGSRGLGEVAAKLLAAGAADVRLTYREGREDAERIVRDIASRGGSARCARLDVLEPEPGLRELGADGWSPTHLGYFATPFIASAAKAAFSTSLFGRFCDFYVTGFLRTVEPLIPRGLGHLLYPSTVFLDQLPAHMGEYAAAKAAGETVCAFLARTRNGLSVCAPRLPRMATDQTASLLPSADPDPAPVLLDILRRFRDAAPSRELQRLGGPAPCATPTS